ncbi:MAG TPA: hypothetical protein PK509_03745 [Catalimonadaceae bacterium]|nr:hypothetical protein [Catalimonadaceae bacterium]
MKKTLFTAIAALASFTGFAQDAKPGAGKMFLAGSLGYSRSTPETPKGAPDPDAAGTLTFSPSFGYFLDDKMAFGARLSFRKESQKNFEGGNSFGFGVFGRYYHSLSETGNFQLFGEAALGYQTSTAQYVKGGTKPDPTTGFGFGVAPGLGWYPGKRLAIEFTLPSLLAFSTSKTSKDSDASAKNFQIGASTLAQPASLTVLFFLK